MLSKKLATGAVIQAFNFNDVNQVGQGISIKNGSTGDSDLLVRVESVRCAEGIVNRVCIKKSAMKQHGFIIIEN